VLPGEDYTVSLTDVRVLVQYLRHYHEWFNIDPDRIFVFGRSFGAIMSMGLGLREDAQDLSSSAPFAHQSSRPNFLIPFSGMADMNCLAAQVLWGDLLQLWFPVSSAPGATVAQKNADSPVWWLTQPELYNRAWTPRICLGYAPPSGLPCGQYIDPHDGGYAAILQNGIDELVMKTNEAHVGLAQHLVTSAGDQYAFGEAMADAMNWAKQQLGSSQALRVVGAEPGALVGYFAGFTTGSVFVPNCSNIQVGLLDFFPLGWKFADNSGQAQLNVFAPAQAIGLDLVLHVADFARCETSQLLHKTWTE
jgi:acetyl esterase/lipase